MDRKDRSIDEGTEGSIVERGITRRQLLWLAPALAAPAALGAVRPAAARPIPPDHDILAPAGSLPSPPQWSVGDIPLRQIRQAVLDCSARRRGAARETNPHVSALGRILADTELWESRLGLANWTILDEREDLHLGSFTFPVSPYSVMADDGDDRFLLMSNGNRVGNFRRDDYLENTQRLMFDRAMWAISNGAETTASIEFDRPLSPEKGMGIFRLLAGHGVRTVIWGNEPNDPYTPWRDDIPAIFEVLTASNIARREHGLESTDLSFPGLAYHGNGEYLEKMLQMAKDLQRRRGSDNPERKLPAQRVSDHYYGPVDQLLPRVRTMRDIMEREGVGHLKYDLTEVGNPTMGPQEKVGDDQLAEGYFPQVASLAIASGLVDRFYVYSLLGSTWDDSLMDALDGRLVIRHPYRAFVLMAKLLARLEGISIVEDGDLVHVAGNRSDGIGFSVVWTRLGGQNLTIPLPKGARSFTALGDEVKEGDGTRLTLWPPNHPALAGPARVIISKRW